MNSDSTLLDESFQPLFTKLWSISKLKKSGKVNEICGWQEKKEKWEEWICFNYTHVFIISKLMIS